MDIRVYIFAGFLDSGKTSFINDTLMNPDFYSNEDTLLIFLNKFHHKQTGSLLKY